MKVCGKLTNDGTNLYPWGYSITVDGKLKIYRGGYFSSKYQAKWNLRKAVKNYPMKPYVYCKETKS